MSKKNKSNSKNLLQMAKEQMKKKLRKRSANIPEGDKLKAELETHSEGLHYVNDLAKQNQALKKLNQFALELSVLPSQENLEAFITKRIKEFAGAKAATFSEYNTSTRTLTPKHVELESGILEKVVDLLGTQIQNIHSVVSEELYEEITIEMVGVRKTLYEASFGFVSRPVGAAIEAFLKVDRIIGVVYLIDGKLFGASLLPMEKGKPDPPRELLENFAHLAASSLRRRNSELELRKSEEKFRVLIENSNELIVCLNEKGLYESVNQVYASLFGKDPDYFVGKTLWDTYPKTHADERYESVKKVFMTGVRDSLEIEILHFENPMCFYATGNPIKDESGKVVSYLIYATDITKIKLAEKELKESERQLLQLNADKDKFFSIIAHDLRSPFNTLLGFTQKMSEELDSMTKNDIHRISVLLNKSATDLYNLLNNLLNWARIKQGLIPFDPQKFDLAEACQDAVDIFKQIADAKKILIHNNVSNDLVLSADIEMVKTVLRNLVSNAIKFTNEDGVIYINAEQTSTFVRVTVSDNGVGIPSAELSKLFEISELQSTRGTSDEKGTGLGLLLCKDFIEKHNGKIWLESEVGKGTDCVFTLPHESNTN